jgi:Txe/YoeB family toxin of Txe-Axe toxin-antitoxin module
MRFGFSPEVTKKLSAIKRKDTKLFRRIEKQLLLFQENPKHPSLRTHKLTDKLDNRWSISINKSLRLIYIIK